MVNNNADICICSMYVGNPLHIASVNGNLRLVEYFINKKVNVNSLNQNGWTPLHFASLKGHLQVIEFLINHGAIVEITNSDFISLLVVTHLFN